MVFPLSFSFFRNLLRSKNSLLNTSSFKCANQLSCNVSISRASSSFCSSVSLASHCFLSKLSGGAAGEAEDVGLGWLKKEVMLALDFGFLASAVARSAAFRFSEPDIVIQRTAV